MTITFDFENKLLEYLIAPGSEYSNLTIHGRWSFLSAQQTEISGSE